MWEHLISLRPAVFNCFKNRLRERIRIIQITILLSVKMTCPNSFSIYSVSIWITSRSNYLIFNIYFTGPTSILDSILIIFIGKLEVFSNIIVAHSTRANLSFLCEPTLFLCEPTIFLCEPTQRAHAVYTVTLMSLDTYFYNVTLTRCSDVKVTSYIR